jgi:putative transposase
MRGKRYPQESIIAILKEAEAGTPIPELCRKHGISDNTIYNWKVKYSGLTVNEARRLKNLKREIM